MIGTLIAMLEMMKQGYLRAYQVECFDDISLAYIGKDEITADQILAGISAEDLAEQEEQDRARLEDVQRAAEAAAHAELPASEEGSVEDGDASWEQGPASSD